MPGDAVIFSSNPIPGNEKAVSRVINELSQKGAKVIFQDTHVSGIACQEEIKLIYSLVHPKYAIPVHGEYKHRIAQAGVAEELGIPKENILILSSGDVLELDDERANVVDKVQGINICRWTWRRRCRKYCYARPSASGRGWYYDRCTYPGMRKQQILAGPDIVSRGFVYVRGSESLMDEAQRVLNGTVSAIADKGITDWGKIKSEIKDSLGDYVWKKTKRRPMILPVIMEI